jgi:hypothetical protein
MRQVSMEEMIYVHINFVGKTEWKSKFERSGLGWKDTYNKRSFKIYGVRMWSEFMRIQWWAFVNTAMDLRIT